MNFTPIHYISLNSLWISITVLFILGTIKKFKKKDASAISWWIKNLSILSALLGFLFYSVHWTKFYQIVNGDMGVSHSIWNSSQLTAYGILSNHLFIAVVGWILGMVITIKKTANQQVDPIVKTPVDEVEAQGSQGHP